MGRISVTVTTIDGVAPSKTLQSVDSKDVISLVSADNLTTGLAHLEVRRWDGKSGGATARIEKWVSSSSYATIQDAINAADQEANAELQANKDASGGYVGLTLRKINFYNVLGTFLSWFTNSNTAARTYTFQDRDGTIADDTDLATKQSTSGKDATGGYAGLTLFKINFKNAANTFTSFFTNTNTAARTYTFQDRDGTIADDTDLALKEATANKATDFSVINDTKFPTTDAVEDSFQPIWFVAATGTDTYAATLTGVVPAAYYTGMMIKATFQNANTGAATVNVNALGAKAIKKGTDGATALAGAEIVTTKIYTLIYDGTNFQIDL